MKKAGGGGFPESITHGTAGASMVGIPGSNEGQNMKNEKIESNYPFDEDAWNEYIAKCDANLMQKSYIATTPEFMAMAQAQGRNFCAKYHPWGLTDEDVAMRIIVATLDAEWVLLAIKEGPARDEATKAVVSTALGWCRDESKENRSRLQPFQVTKVALAGGDIDAAYVDLGKKFAEKYGCDPDERDKMEYLKEAIKLLGKPYSTYCFEYLDPWQGDGSWEKVAALHRINPSTFRHRELKEMATRGKRIWSLMWGN